MDIYKISEASGGGGTKWHGPGPPYIFCLLFIKTEKVQEHDLYLNQILHYFDFKKNPRINNKYFAKRGTHGAMLPFLSKVSIAVLIDS